MPDRRTFLKQSLAAMSAVGAPGAVFSLEQGIARASSTPFRYVVYDPDIAASVRFAEASRRLGSTLVAARTNEIGDMWFDKLKDDLRENPGLVAGLTDPSAAFQFRTLSHDVWHYTVLQSEHMVEGDLTRHRFESFGKELNSAELATGSTADWPAALAQDLHLAAWRDLAPQPRTFVRSDSIDTEHFEAWVIAPMHKRKPVDA